MSRAALGSGEYAAAVEVSRFHVKHVSACRTAPPSSSISTNSNSNDAARLDKDEANAWMARAVAWAGVGSPFLANVHCRTVLRLCPSYPHIHAVLAFLDGYELDHAEETRRVTLGGAVAREARRLRAVWGGLGPEAAKRGSGAGAGVGRVDICRGVSAEQMRFLLTGESGDAVAGAGAGTVRADLHMDDGNDDGDDDDEEATSSRAERDHHSPGSAAAVAAVAELVDAVTTRAVDVGGTARPLLRAARRVFYDGQVLYMELLRHSAEVKFMLAYALAGEAAAAAGSCNGSGSGSDDAAAAAYAVTLRSAALVNAAVCRVHRTPSRTVAGQPSPSTRSLWDVPAPTLPDALAADAVALVNAGLGLAHAAARGAPEAAAASLLAARFRRLFVLEKLQLYTDALAELGEIEAHTSASAWAEPAVAAETVGSLGAALPVTCAGLFVTDASDDVRFTQRHVLDSPLPWPGRGAHGDSDGSTPRLLTRRAIDAVREKRQRLQYLQKRYGLQ